MSSGKRSDTKYRPQISGRTLEKVCDGVRAKLVDRLNNEKGYGAWLSRHEILGMAVEEHDEFIKAVHEGDLKDVRRELVDLAVGCLFGIACIDSDALDW